MPILGGGMGEWVWRVDRMLLMVKPKYSEKNVAQCYCLPQISHGLAWDWIKATALRDRLSHGMVLLVSLMLMHRILYRIVGSLKVYTPSYCVANHVVYPLFQEQLRKLETLFHFQARWYKDLFLLFHFYLVCQNDKKRWTEEISVLLQEMYFYYFGF